MSGKRIYRVCMKLVWKQYEKELLTQKKKVVVKNENRGDFLSLIDVETKLVFRKSHEENKKEIS